MATRRSVISGSRNSIGRDARKAFQIEGIAEIQDKLAKVIDGVTGKKAKDVYYAAGKILSDEIRQSAPYDEKRTEGFHIRDAVFVSRGDDNKSDVLVGVNYRKAPHSGLIEYGTVKMPAQPYVRPSITRAGPKAGATIKDGLLKIVDDATK